jgi:hypothetical protein
MAYTQRKAARSLRRNLDGHVMQSEPAVRQRQKDYTSLHSKIRPSLRPGAPGDQEDSDSAASCKDGGVQLR